MDVVYTGRRIKNQHANISGKGSFADEALVSVRRFGLLDRLEPSATAKRKSPCGFNWGYGGSGPAALAHSILCDYTGNKHLADRLHQRLKAEVVSRFPESGFTLTGAELEDWIVHAVTTKE